MLISRKLRPFRAVLLAALVLAGARLGGAAICHVPSASYPTITGALADATCDPIQIAAGALTENLEVSRSVSLVGGGSATSTLSGWVWVRGATTELTISGLRVDAAAASTGLCHASGLHVEGGARAAGADLVVVGRPTSTFPCGFFSDGFESGDLTPWSARRP